MTGDARSERRGPTYERLLRQERLILDVTEQLAGALENNGVTRAELARRMGRTPGFVSQVLSGGKKPHAQDHCRYRWGVVPPTVAQGVPRANRRPASTEGGNRSA